MKIKKGDKVIVVSGKDKGKTGPVLRAMPQTDRVVVEGVNIVKKHRRGGGAARKGQIVDKTMPVHVSNVMLLDPKTGKGTRVGFTMKGDKKVRVAKKSGSTIE
jgi:large subunit ribosomal protein L24